ncbi:glycosyltransferase family 4 protein [Candidatus Woesearchaeota archaeon]|nr:glycosyltransferase family 4 protein [Candidatus Woesearchaeota archaeon]
MKNVLVLASTFPRWKNDSTPSFVFQLSNLLAEKYKVIVLAPHHFNAAKKEKIGNLSIQRFRYFFPEKYQKIAYGAGVIPNVKESFLAKMQIPGFLASQIKSAKDIVEKEKIELIHAHWLIPQGVIGVLLKKIYRLPLIVTIHGSDLFPLKSIFFKKIQKNAARNADVITVNSKTAEQELISRFPEVKSNVRVIPMGIDAKIFKPKNVKNKFKKYKNNKIILFVGRLNEQKGVQYLIKAIQSAVLEIKNAKLLVIGEGDYRKYLEKLANELELNGSVEFLGAKPYSDLADYYNLADVFVLPSVTSKIGVEGLGLVLVEAMSCGACVIGSSSGGIKDVIKDGVNGLIFQEKNSEELASKIIKVLKDSKLRKKLRENGLRHAQNYSWEIISKKFLKIYEYLLK